VTLRLSMVMQWLSLVMVTQLDNDVVQFDHEVTTY
jgi:hypothetical protein